MLTITADFIVPVEGPPLAPGHVRIDDGRVVSVAEGRAEGDEVIDYGQSAIIPGFVNAHTHLGCAFLKSVADDSSFLEWITGDITPRVIDAVNERPDEVAQAAQVAARELLEGGVTTVVDSFFHDCGRAAILTAGMHGFHCPEIFGSMHEDLGPYSEEVQGIMDRCGMGGDGIEIGVAPHAPYTCPPEILEQVSERARREDILLTIHLGESVEELTFLKDAAGPMHGLFASGDRGSRYRFGLTPVALAGELGLLRPRALLVHAVQVSPDDMLILAGSGASVVHCPTSNFKLAVGIAPVVELLEQGVNVCLGTDSPASIGKMDMFEEMRLCVLGQRARLGEAERIDAACALEMATLAGARAVGRAGETGSLVAGKAADLAVVRLDRPRHQPLSDPVSALVFSATPDDVIATWVGGELRHEARA